MAGRTKIPGGRPKSRSVSAVLFHLTIAVICNYRDRTRRSGRRDLPAADSDQLGGINLSPLFHGPRRVALSFAPPYEDTSHLVPLFLVLRFPSFALYILTWLYIMEIDDSLPFSEN